MFSCTGVDNGLNAQIEVNLYSVSYTHLTLPTTKSRRGDLGCGRSLKKKKKKKTKKQK